MPVTPDETIAGLRKPHWHYPFDLVSMPTPILRREPLDGSAGVRRFTSASFLPTAEEVDDMERAVGYHFMTLHAAFDDGGGCEDFLFGKRFAFSYTKTPLPSGIFSRATEASAS